VSLRSLLVAILIRMNASLNSLAVWGDPGMAGFGGKGRFRMKTNYKLLGHLLLIGAKTWAWADLRMIAAGSRTPGVDSAAAACRIEEDAVVVGPTGQGENFVFEVEVIDQAGFFQPLGELLGRFPGFKRIYELHAYQILHLYFHRQAAADRTAVVAQPFTVFDPGRRALDVAVVPGLFLHEA
jgi:hypothetical protein